MTILVAEDESQLNTMIRDYLGNLGWTTFGAEDGIGAMKLFDAEQPDFVLLDVMMPGMDGLDVARRIRESSDVPIIFITAMAEESDTLIGLELGADDYITKPFSLKEMAARIRAVMRRMEKGHGDEAVLNLGDVSLDPKKRTVTRAGVAMALTAVQFDILHGFMRQPGRVFTRNEILGFFQDFAWEGYERTIDVHIKNIRRVLEPDRSHPQYLQTVRGIGYRFADGENS